MRRIWCQEISSPCAQDKIPTDLRLLEAHNLQIEEAILTGESTVVEKQIGVIENESVIGDRKNLLFSGTTISAGTAKGVVIASGGDTELGHINQMMATVESTRTLCYNRWIVWEKPFSS